MRIQHNIMAMNAYRNMGKNNGALSKNLEKLSSGYRINRAGDDAAGLAISEKMRAQISGLDQAQKNAQSGINLVQTAEGALTEVHDMLNRMVTLTTQAANGTYSKSDREKIQAEINSLTEEIDRIADNSNYNGTKLLDGSIGPKAATSLKEWSNLSSVNMADGITINAPVAGAGGKQTYELDFTTNNTLLNKGDEISFDVFDADGNKVATEKFVLDGDSGTVSTSSNTTKFYGATAADQLNSLAEAINKASAAGNSGNGYGYTAEVKDGKITITAGATGEPAFTLDNVAIKDNVIKSNCQITQAGAYDAGVADTAAASKVLVLNTADISDSNGDKVKFTFNVNGNTMTATLTAGVDFEVGDSVEETATNIAKALNTGAGNGNVTFDDNTGTATADESTFKVGDYFTFAADTAADAGKITITPNGTDTSYVGFTKVEILDGTDATGATVKHTDATGANTPAGLTGGAAKAEVSTVTFENNFAKGEKFTVNGTLMDGREFEVTLTAGEDFDIGATTADSITNIKNALEASTAKVIVDGKAHDTMEVKDLFTSGGDFTISDADKATGKLTFTSRHTGATGVGHAATISPSGTRVTANEKVEVELTEKLKGADQTKAENKLTFEDGTIEQGTTIKIDGKTYEIVTDADNRTHEDNIAVVVDDPSSGAAVAEALAAAIKKADGTEDATYTKDSENYDVSAAGNTLTITSTSVGTGVAALEIEMGESKQSSVLEFTSTEHVAEDGTKSYTANVKAGDTVTINGKTYEFTSGSRTSKEEYVQVDIKGLTQAEDIAEKLATAVNGAEAGAMAKTIARAEGGKVVLTSAFDPAADAKEEYAYAAPEIELPAAANGLTLQIGSEAVETINVSIDSMKADALGIKGLDVSDEKAANASLEKVKTAIEQVSVQRGNLGAVQNRLEHTINNLGVMEENIQDAEANIRDTDIADEMMAYTKNNILIQSAQAMLAQANQAPQGVLQLMG